MPGIWTVFVCIFSTRDLRRNLRIWWRVRANFDDVIFLYLRPYCQVIVYCSPKDQIFNSSINQPKRLRFFCSVALYILWLKWYWWTTWENLPIVLQYKLCHFVALYSLRTKQSTKLLLIQRKFLINVAKITLIIPLKPTYIENFTFISSQLSMHVG